MTLNFVQIETKTGLKEFELFHGDITNLPFEVDIICISAFANQYSPEPKSIIGQFRQKGIDIDYLSRKPTIDFRKSLGIWITKEMNFGLTKSIICVEFLGHNRTIEEVIKNLFAVISALEIQGEKNKSIAIPVLGSGLQGIDSKKIIPLLLETSLDFLKYSRYLNKVYFVVHKDQSAEEFNSAMDVALDRKKIVTPQGELADILIKELDEIVSKLIDKNEDVQVFQDLKRVINTDFRPFEFGAISRKTIEYILKAINPDSEQQFELVKKIGSLRSKGIASWIQSYLHLIRVFGNEAIHHKDLRHTNPEYVSAKDLEIGIYCLIQVLDFYIQYNSNNSSSINS